jgi:hypothetical protein
MSKETYIEVRENLNYIYSLVNGMINNLEMQKENGSDIQIHFPIDEIMLKLGDISSILQIDIHRLDMIFSIDNIQSKVNYKVQ